jgi:hypothetical protein
MHTPQGVGDDGGVEIPGEVGIAVRQGACPQLEVGVVVVSFGKFQKPGCSGLEFRAMTSMVRNKTKINNITSQWGIFFIERSFPVVFRFLRP